jgi:hypothetical protein
MKADYTHISVILDRTGSMESIRDDTIGGFNAFLRQQQAESGQATLTLVQFDSQDPYEVIHHFKLMAAVPPLTRDTFVPRATTPLLDAMGHGINDLEQSLSQMAETARPARVVMVIITDGQENASREFTKQQVEKMIRTKQSELDWQFVFLSADIGAIRDAVDTGVRADAMIHFNKTSADTNRVFEAASARISDYRAARRKNVSFTDEDRAHREDDSN